MHQNLLKAGFAFADKLSVRNENVGVTGVIDPPTKVLSASDGSFCCTYACHELHFSS